MKGTWVITSVFSGLLVLLGFIPVTVSDAGAERIRVKCEKKGIERSKVSVDGKDLVPGEYKAQVMSGIYTVTSPLAPSVWDEVSVDFDTNMADPDENPVTPIPANFIQGTVTGKILDADDMTVIEATVPCDNK